MTQMPIPTQLFHQTHGLLSEVQPVARSIGIDPEAVDECIARLAQSGLTQSYAGASCSFSDGVFGNPSTEISGIAEDAEDAKTKKATVHEEETSCSFLTELMAIPQLKSVELLKLPGLPRQISQLVVPCNPADFDVSLGSG